VLCRDIRVEAIIKTVKWIFEAFPFKNGSGLPICRSEYTTAKVKWRRNGVSYIIGIAVLLTRRLNLQLNGDYGQFTAFYTEIHMTSDSFELGFPVSLCSAVSTSVAIKVQDRVDDKTEVSYCHLIFMSSFQFTNRTLWILNVDKCWNIFSEKKNENWSSFLRCVNKICSRLIQRNQIFSDGSTYWNFETFSNQMGFLF
jgi:hypothetical protein